MGCGCHRCLRTRGRRWRTADNANGVILAWYDTPNLDILAQRISSTRQVLWALAGVPMCRAANQGPGLCIAPSGVGAVIAWSDTRNSTSPDIYAQGIDGTG